MNLSETFPEMISTNILLLLDNVKKNVSLILWCMTVANDAKQCLQLCSPIICYFQEPLVLLELVGVLVESRKVSHHSVASVLDPQLHPVPEGGQVD